MDGSEHSSESANDTDEEMEINSDLQRGDGMTETNNECTLINVISKSKRIYKTLNASGLRLEVKFGQPKMNDVTKWLWLCITELLSIMESDLSIEPQDRVGIIFTNTNNTKADFSISFRPFSQYSAESILYELDKVIQSNTLFFTDDNLVVNVDHVKIPVGYGQRRTHIGKSTSKYYDLHKKSIFSANLRPEDYGLCLAVSIVVGIAYLGDDIKPMLIYDAVVVLTKLFNFNNIWALNIE